ESAYREMEIHGSMYECYHSIGDDKNALLHFARSRTIHDSLLVKKNVQQIGQLHIQYQTERKDQQIAALDTLNREKTKRSIFSLAGLLGFLVLSGFLFFQYRVIHRRNRL